MVSMVRICVLFSLVFNAAPLLLAENYTLTVRQAVERALTQNPDVVMARLDEFKAAQGIRLARDPFVPRLDVGSGLAYTNGYPQSVEGSAPSIVTAKANAFVFNRQQTYILAQAHENARGAAMATASKRDEIAFRTASLYLDLDRAAKLGDVAQKQVESLTKVAASAHSRVEEGYELPIEEKRAIVELKRSQQRLEAIQSDQDSAERSLAVALGYTAEDHIKVSGEELSAGPLPPSEEAAVASALESNKDLRRLESALVAKGLEIKGDKSQRLPKVDLVAQYAYFSRFNHLDEYFLKFQNNNEELGLAFSVPLLPGPGISAQVKQAEADSAKIRVEYRSARNRIMLDIHQAYQDLRKAQSSTDVTQADLDWARESLSVLLAQMAEGRSSLRQVEEARIVENEKWLAFYDAQYAAERARLTVLRETGDLVASLK
jgi:outer membrane protein TolC